MNSEEKRYTHSGVAINVFILLFVVLFLVLCVIKGLSYAYLIMIAFLLLCLLCFNSITITIHDTYFSFKLGIGLIKKRYKMANIKSCKPIFAQGFGIRKKLSIDGKIRTKYNVTGFKAIELEFHDRDEIVQIGTYHADEISKQIQSLIDGDKIQS